MAHVQGPGRSIVVTVPETGSTQDDLRALAVDAGGWPHLSGLRAVRQRAGRGRGERAWDTHDLTALTATLVLRPAFPTTSWPWIPLLVGCAVLDAIAELGPSAAADAGQAQARSTGDRRDPGLKWPNDVLLPAATAIDGWGPWRKVGGILAEVLPGQAGVLVGIGINLDGAAPVAWATTLRGHGIAVSADGLLEAIRAHLATTLASDPRTWRAAVEHRCVSIGAQVVAHMPGGASVTGTARAIDEHGGLVLQAADGTERVVLAGDIEHLRAATSQGR